MCDSCDVRSSPPRAQSREPVYLISARMALGIWGLEPRGSLQRPEGGRGHRCHRPSPRALPGSGDVLANSLTWSSVSLWQESPGSRQHYPPHLQNLGRGTWLGVSVQLHTALGGVQLRERCTPSSPLVPTWGTAEPPQGLSPKCPSQYHTRHVPAECSGIPGALTTCLLLQGILHHHGQVDNQHQGRCELVELGAERVHPHVLRCHCRGLHQGSGAGLGGRHVPGHQGHM